MLEKLYNNLNNNIKKKENELEVALFLLLYCYRVQ